MEKWLPWGTKPPLYVAHVVYMLLQKWFLFKGHHIIRWFVETSYEEDEEGIIYPVVGNLTY
jgi:hypothetical protein